VASHVGWLISAWQAYTFHNELLLGMAVATITFSSLYHYTGRLSIEVVDTTFAVLYLMVGSILLWLGEASFSEWGLGILVTLSALGIYGISTRRRHDKDCDSYIGWHALWHITASYLTTLIYAIYFGQLAF
jgi:small-conductance mechanosensitive channel